MALIPRKKTEVDFAEECRAKFVLYCQSRKLAPFHVDKDKYAAMAWAQVDAYLDYLDVQGL